MSGERDEIAALLSDHVAREPMTRSRPVRCVCGAWESENGVSGADRWEQHRMHVADALLPLVDQLQMEAGAQALDDAADALFNGAGDPEQELYDAGASPWLTLRAMTMRAAFVLKQRHERNRD